MVLNSLIKLLLLILITLTLISCTDQLGIEENVRKTLIDSVVKIKPKNVKFTHDSISFKITENITNIQNNVPNQIEWIIKSDFVKTIIDTNGIHTNLSLDLDIENINPSDSIRYIFYEHIKAFQLKIDSISSNGSYNANQALNSRLWSALFIENSNKSLNSLEGSSSPLKLVFYEDVRNKADGYINLELIANFINSNQSARISFLCQIFIHYKIE